MLLNILISLISKVPQTECSKNDLNETLKIFSREEKNSTECSVTFKNCVGLKPFISNKINCDTECVNHHTCQHTHYKKGKGCL